VLVGAIGSGQCGRKWLFFVVDIVCVSVDSLRGGWLLCALSAMPYAAVCA
jgi:hypothetical protein